MTAEQPSTRALSKRGKSEGGEEEEEAEEAEKKQKRSRKEAESKKKYTCHKHLIHFPPFFSPPLSPSLPRRCSTVKHCIDHVALQYSQTHRV